MQKQSPKDYLLHKKQEIEVPRVFLLLKALSHNLAAVMGRRNSISSLRKQVGRGAETIYTMEKCIIINAMPGLTLTLYLQWSSDI